MSAYSRTADVQSGLSKWQIALLVGVPICAVGAGYWYYRYQWKSAFPSNVLGKDPPNVGGTLKASTDVSKTTSAKTLKESRQKVLTPLEKAQLAKAEGNKCFKNRDYKEALKHYSEAIELCPKDATMDLATFYQNRAATHEYLGDNKAARDDCTTALELNPKYVKALQRRAKVCETMEDLQQALEDVTAVCILECFSNVSALQAADRILKQLGKMRAKETWEKKDCVFPSKCFIRTLLASFKDDPVMQDVLQQGKANGYPEEPLIGMAKAKEALRNEDYELVLDACEEELAGDVASPHHAEALCLRGTFHYLRSDLSKAVSDYSAVVSMEDAPVKVRANAIIRRALVKLQLDDFDGCKDDFEEAIRINPSSADAHYQRGQVFFLLEKYEEALEDFKKAVALAEDDFPVAEAQQLYTEYKISSNADKNQVNSIIKRFQEVEERYPKCGELMALLAQIYVEQNDLNKANACFDRAIQADPENATLLVHKGMLQLQTRMDIVKATEYLKQAIEVDNKCGYAYEMLGTLEVQKGNLPYSVELFNEAIRLAKTEDDMAHLFSLKEAAIAQKHLSEKLGVTLPSFPGM